MTEEYKKMIVKLYVLGMSVFEILQNISANPTGAPSEKEVIDFISEYEDHLLEKFSCGRSSMIYVREYESLEELERKSWSSKDSKSIIETKKIKLKLLEFISSDVQKSRQTSLFKTE